ncbi:MAG TPA: glycosyltransferase [Phycicoccus sp.]|nr:glycosyltransferase [Phycicoccus sp.]
MSTPRLLLVSPAFHGYWRAIQGALERRGYAVTTHLYDVRTPLARARHKLTREVLPRLGATDRGASDGDAAVAAIRMTDPHVLLVVKGDTLGEVFWDRAQQVPRRALWLYDEIRRTRHTTASLAAAGPIASYSPKDVATLTAQGLPAIHVPLAFDARTQVPPRARADEVTFVGARYPNREALLTALAAAGLPVRAYGRDWSGHPWDRLRTLRLRTPALPAGRDLNRPQAYAVFAASAASINIHGDQDGFTMRTFEVPGVGGVHLVDRADVDSFYDPEREVAVFGDAEEAIEVARRVRRDLAWAEAIRRAGQARTLAEHTFDHRAAALEGLWA